MPKAGVVLEIKDKQAVVMTPDGGFLHVPARAEWQVGMEVELVKRSGARCSVGRRPLIRRSYLWGKIALATSTACLVLFGGFWAAVGGNKIPQAYAYVAVDMNPSVAYTVNSFGKVLAAQGLNGDGRKLVQTFSPKGMTLKQVLNKTVQVAVTLHMLPQYDTILVTTAPEVSNESTKKISKEAETDIHQAISANPKATSQHPVVYSLSVSKSVWKAARQMQVSPGKLVAYLAASNGKNHVTMQDLQGQALGNIMAQSQTKQLLNQLQKKSAPEIENWMQQVKAGKQTGVRGSRKRSSQDNLTGFSQWFSHSPTDFAQTQMEKSHKNQEEKEQREKVNLPSGHDKYSSQGRGQNWIHNQGTKSPERSHVNENARQLSHVNTQLQNKQTGAHPVKPGIGRVNHHSKRRSLLKSSHTYLSPSSKNKTGGQRPSWNENSRFTNHAH